MEDKAERRLLFVEDDGVISMLHWKYFLLLVIITLFDDDDKDDGEETSSISISSDKAGSYSTGSKNDLISDNDDSKDFLICSASLLTRLVVSMLCNRGLLLMATII